MYLVLTESKANFLNMFFVDITNNLTEDLDPVP